MAEEMKAFPQLSITPPLLLKELGFDDLRLVFLSKGILQIWMPNVINLSPQFVCAVCFIYLH